MELTPTDTKIKRTACFLGFIQGLAYGIMAIICIVLYISDTPEYNSETHMDDVNYYIQVMFFGDYVFFTNQTLYPPVFAAFVVVYFLLSLGWISVSISLWFKRGAVLPNYFRSWAYVTVLISLWDFITVVILGADYWKCLSFAATWMWGSGKVVFEGICANSILPVMVIAARGFVLWFVNVIFAYILYSMAQRLRKAPLRGHVQQFPAQNMTQPPAYPVQQPASYPSTYMQQPQPGSAQFRPAVPNRSPFEYPVHIPEPDYHYQQQHDPSALKKY